MKAIEFSGVSVHFPPRREVQRSLKELLIHRVGRGHDEGLFWALKDVDLTVRAGESWGVVGRNGAGKSTLLRLVAGIIFPSTGQLRVWGKVAPVIELAAGFDRDLTGRENILFNASLLGIPGREARRRIPEIVEFAQLEEVVDAPLRTYSSGMMARLAFAVATSVRADIVLLDEVLAVGDQFFRARCSERIGELCREGTTVLFVSHDLTSVARLCQRAVWLERGHTAALGEVEDVLSAYRSSQPASTPAAPP